MPTPQEIEQQEATIAKAEQYVKLWRNLGEEVKQEGKAGFRERIRGVVREFAEKREVNAPVLDYFMDIQTILASSSDAQVRAVLVNEEIVRLMVAMNTVKVEFERSKSDFLAVVPGAAEPSIVSEKRKSYADLGASLMSDIDKALEKLAKENKVGTLRIIGTAVHGAVVHGARQAGQMAVDVVGKVKGRLGYDKAKQVQPESPASPTTLEEQLREGAEKLKRSSSGSSSGGSPRADTATAVRLSPKPLPAPEGQPPVQRAVKPPPPPPPRNRQGQGQGVEAKKPPPPPPPRNRQGQGQGVEAKKPPPPPPPRNRQGQGQGVEAKKPPPPPPPRNRQVQGQGAEAIKSPPLPTKPPVRSGFEVVEELKRAAANPAIDTQAQAAAKRAEAIRKLEESKKKAEAKPEGTHYGNRLKPPPPPGKKG